MPALGLVPARKKVRTRNKRIIVTDNPDKLYEKLDDALMRNFAYWRYALGGDQIATDKVVDDLATKTKMFILDLLAANPALDTPHAMLTAIEVLRIFNNAIRPELSGLHKGAADTKSPTGPSSC